MIRVSAMLAAIIVALMLSSQSHAASHNRAPVSPPTAPCDADHVLDIEIIDGVLFECGCDHMMFGPPVCTWYEVTSQAEDPMRARAVIRRAKAHHRRVVVIRALPAVVS